jgi:hypothetical protein
MTEPISVLIQKTIARLLKRDQLIFKTNQEIEEDTDSEEETKKICTSPF